MVLGGCVRKADLLLVRLSVGQRVGIHGRINLPGPRMPVNIGLTGRATYSHRGIREEFFRSRDGLATRPPCCMR